MKKEQVNDLIKDVASGSEIAIDTLYRLLKRPVSAFVYPIVQDLFLVEDVYQETMLKVAKCAPFFSYLNGISWILTIAKHNAINLVLKRKNDVVLRSDFPMTQIRSGKNYAEEEIERLAIMEEMDKLLRAKDRQLVSMKILSGYTFEDLAKLLGKPVHSIKNRYYNAIKTLQKSTIFKSSLLKEDNDEQNEDTDKKVE